MDRYLKIDEDISAKLQSCVCDMNARRPDGVAMSLRTVRGIVSSNWTRNDQLLRERQAKNTWQHREVNCPLVSLQLLLPPGVHGSITIPLLGGTRVLIGSKNTSLVAAWDAKYGDLIADSVQGIRVMKTLCEPCTDGVLNCCQRNHSLILQVGSGKYDLHVVSPE